MMLIPYPFGLHESMYVSSNENTETILCIDLRFLQPKSTPNVTRHFKAAR
ncbi:MAG TPA: hypothetical protein DEB17_05030 [Chlorobaculum sp.]|uniref:Uncharacterized protein n=1 Tax=Chlorobaculum tepidum (strain ATCC 49652 / DSM 12025 / NBRC 103806 / TLS) TaxID=194439 RepID=Q8KAY3_CHLTE|nr:hypothetical protein CT2017 [Chlorobaculum tepidum TLS]HBU23348.1 hypothetical protein [Chlorobaculum sp.]